MTKAREVRFFLDWGHQWPLWESGTEKYAMEPSDYGLSEELTSCLRSLYDHWFQHVDPFAGWDTETNAEIYFENKADVVRRLRQELPADVKLVVE